MRRIRLEKDFTTTELDTIKNLSSSLKLLPLTAEILFTRGIDSIEKVKLFKNPGKHNFLDPFMLKGMDSLINRLETAKLNDEVVVIYGDYDADGVCASVILYKALANYGIDAKIFIPERVEGYGLSIENIESVANDSSVDLFITVDCGISSYKEVEYIKDLGIDIIVTDHHELPNILPDCIIVNPKLNGQNYPYDNLCGAGVALKIAYALNSSFADSLIDLAALATVADSVPLIGENRDIVSAGLKMFSSSKIRLAFKLLLSSNKTKSATAQTLSYGIAPKINAAGRMGSAVKAVNLLLSDDVVEIEQLAQELEYLNSERQIACEEVKNQATLMLEKKSKDFNIIALYSNEWRGGLVGIVAAKLVEKYYCPAILFVNNNGILKGSARSLENINIYQALSSVEDLIINFGGHAQAAGVSIREEDFDEFEKRLSEYLSKEYKAIDYLPTTYISGFDFDSSCKKTVEELMSLEPFGMQNKQPLFGHNAYNMTVRKIKFDSPHLSITTNNIELMYFNGENNLQLLSDGVAKTLAYEINVSTYKGKEYVKGFVRDIESSFPNSIEESYYIMRNNIKQLTANNNFDIIELTSNGIMESIRTLSGFGTCLILNDEKNHNLFSQIQQLRTEIYSPIVNNKSDFLLLSPSNCDLTGYKKVIYLDKPLNIAIKTDAEIFVNSEIIGYNFIESIDTDRNRLLDIYDYVRKGEKVQAKDSASLFIKLMPPFTSAEFIFAIEVFLELNLVSFIGDRVYINKGVKADLSSSVIYTKLKAKQSSLIK